MAEKKCGAWVLRKATEFYQVKVYQTSISWGPANLVQNILKLIFETKARRLRSKTDFKILCHGAI
jgi:hypothetical protein